MCGPDPAEPDVAAGGASVAEHMSGRILAVRDDCSLETAMDTVLASGRRHLVIVDPKGTFLAVLPAEAITIAWRTSLTQRGRFIRDLITTPPVHLSPDASLHTAASVMLSNSVDALGVLDPDGRLVGILTWGDIVAAVAERGRA